MLSDSLAVHRGALLALGVALAWVVLWRWRGARHTAALALPLGMLAGLLWVLDGFSASPRQLPERFPVLAAAALALALPLAVWPRAWLAGLLAVLAALSTAWWMAGAPQTVADLRRVLPVLVLLGLCVGLLYRETAGPWRGQAAALALAAALWAATPSGLWPILGAILLASGLPLLMLGTTLPDAGRLALAMLMAGLMAAPLLVRGAAQDWAAAAAPLGLLLLGPRLAAGRASWQAPVLMLLGGALPVLLAWWLAR